MDGTLWRRVVGGGLVAIVLGVGACGGSSDEATEFAGGGGGGSGQAIEAPADELGGPRAADDSSAGLAADAGDLPTVGPSIIKTADVSVEVPSGDFRTALQEATATAGRFGGFIVSTSTAGEDSMSGTIVLRVPSDDFEAALASIRDLGEVTGEEVSGRDVTQEFVDLEARLRNLKAQESVLLGLMDEADTIASSIRVQNSLSGIQLEIEQIQGRLNYLEDRAELSTITATIVETGAPVAKEPGMLGRAWSQAVDVAEAIVYGLVVSLGFVVPLVLLAAVAYAGVRVGMRFMRHRPASEAAE